MTREEIVKGCENQPDYCFRVGFMSGAIFVLRTQLERKRQAYINKIGYEPDSPSIEDWSLQIDLLTDKINKL